MMAADDIFMLQQLNELYNAWIEDFTLCPVLTIETDRIDFVRFPDHFLSVKSRVLTKLQIAEKVYVNGRS